jgi:hypothetical protein
LWKLADKQALDMLKNREPMDLLEPCNCGRYQCYRCNLQVELMAEQDFRAEIERRKKLKGE